MGQCPLCFFIPVRGPSERADDLYGHGEKACFIENSVLTLRNHEDFCFFGEHGLGYLCPLLWGEGEDLVSRRQRGDCRRLFFCAPRPATFHPRCRPPPPLRQYPY